jgi:hypothetical protein
LPLLAVLVDVAYERPAIEAAAGPLEAGVLGFQGVVGVGILSGVHSDLLSSVGRVPGGTSSAEPFSFVTILCHYEQHYAVIPFKLRK